MDMTLYALVMSKFNEQTQCETWNGFRIEIVDELPSFQAPNVIYFVKTCRSGLGEDERTGFLLFRI